MSDKDDDIEFFQDGPQ
ncbi:Protein of unknown function [Propionibacterium freudenreichii]|nr:Protein of unknown function [Propionibacterium freudenreichii]